MHFTKDTRKVQISFEASVLLLQISTPDLQGHFRATTNPDLSLRLHTKVHDKVSMRMDIKSWQVSLELNLLEDIS